MDVNIIWQTVSLVILDQDYSSQHDSSKNMAARAGLIFPIYLKQVKKMEITIYKHFKNLLVRNYWTDFNITWHKCF